MINENQEFRDPTHNLVRVLVSMLVGGMAGAVTMLLLAPKSGKDTRIQIRDKGIELRDRTAGYIEDSVSQVRSNLNDLTSNGRNRIKEIKHHGQKLAIEQLDHITEAAKAGKKAIRKS
jgi:gas vesicle protein